MRHQKPPPTQEHFFSCISRVLERQFGSDAIQSIRDIAEDPEVWGKERPIPWKEIGQRFPKLDDYLPVRRRKQELASA